MAEAASPAHLRVSSVLRTRLPSGSAQTVAPVREVARSVSGSGRGDRVVRFHPPFPGGRREARTQGRFLMLAMPLAVSVTAAAVSGAAAAQGGRSAGMRPPSAAAPKHRHERFLYAATIAQSASDRTSSASWGRSRRRASAHREPHRHAERGRQLHHFAYSSTGSGSSCPDCSRTDPRLRCAAQREACGSGPSTSNWPGERLRRPAA
jgi:hypothetical protein